MKRILLLYLLFISLCSVTVSADINGSELMDDPWGTIWSPFTDLFENIVGNGMVFFIFPIIILTFGVYIKTEDVVMPIMFLITSCALFSSINLFTGAFDVAIIFIVFTAFGFTALFIKLFYMSRS